MCLPTAHFASSDLEDFVHSASITGLPGGDLMAAWFAGTREGAADVQIRAARFDASSGQWSAERVLASRESTQRAVGKHIRKLGNPVISLAPDNRLWLFYVSVSLGGWAGSAVNAIVSDDLGETWSAPRQLVTSPFLNISTLVRAAPVFHADGSIGLPVYHEFLGKFPEYLHLSAAGEVLGKYRIGKGRDSLQPTVVALGERRAVALLRYAGEEHHRVLASYSEDAGRSWSYPQPVEPSNPNSSLAAVGRPDGSLLVAMNDLEDGRFRLTLYATDANLANWRTLGELDESPNPWGEPIAQDEFPAVVSEKFRASGGKPEQQAQFLERVSARMCSAEGCTFDYEYPYFTRDREGAYHLVYSWNDMFIKHLSFNEAWLSERRPHD
jgi:predicted neuraminidase